MTSCTFDYLTQDLKNMTFNAGMWCFTWAIPIVCIFFFYIGIVKAIMDHHDAMNATSSQLGAQATNEKDRQVEMQMTKLAATTIFLFLASWAPYSIITAVGMLYPHEAKMVSPVWSVVPLMMAKTSGIWNPIVYAISHPKFRAEIDKSMPWLLGCCALKPEEKKSKSNGESCTSNMSNTQVSEECHSIAMTTSASVATIATNDGETPAANPAGGQGV